MLTAAAFATSTPYLGVPLVLMIAAAISAVCLALFLAGFVGAMAGLALRMGAARAAHHRVRPVGWPVIEAVVALFAGGVIAIGAINLFVAQGPHIIVIALIAAGLIGLALGLSQPSRFHIRRPVG
jgi:hypothetical protein